MYETTVRQQYDRLAAIYDRRWNSYITKTLTFLKDFAAISPSATVLDIACGTGEFARLLLAEHPQQQITGIDLSAQMLNIARYKLANYPQVSLQQASVEALPFENQSFDVVISASAFHYFDRPEIALQEMKRVLKPDGKLVILDWCKDYWWCRLCDLVLPAIDPAHRYCYTEAQFHSLLQRAGFCLGQADRVRVNLVWGLMVATAVPD